MAAELTSEPTDVPTFDPTDSPTFDPSDAPTFDPTSDPSDAPTFDPTFDPTNTPTFDPTDAPTFDPTDAPTFDPVYEPTLEPTYQPTHEPTYQYQTLNEDFNVALLCVLLTAIFVAVSISIFFIYRSVKRRKDNGEEVCDFWGCCLGPGHGHCKAEVGEDDGVVIKDIDSKEMEQTRDFTMEFQQHGENDVGQPMEAKFQQRGDKDGGDNLQDKKISSGAVQEDGLVEAAVEPQGASIQMMPVSVVEGSQSDKGPTVEYIGAEPNQGSM